MPEHDKPESALAKALAAVFEGRRPWVAVDETYLTVVAGEDAAALRSEAASFLGVSPATLRLVAFDAPENPLRSYLMGGEGTPNWKAEGVAARLGYAHLYAPGDWQQALAAALLFLRQQLDVGIMSVPGGPKNGGRPVSEAWGPSHPQWWMNAYAALRFVARRSAHAELLRSTGELWRQLLSLQLIASSPEGRDYLAGPRATRARNKEGGLDAKRTGTNSCVDAICAEVFYPASRWPDQKLKGVDMLGARIVRALLQAGDDLGNPPRQPEAVTDADLPRMVDPLVVARGAGWVASWIDGPGTNSTDPGYQWWSYRDATGGERFGVEAQNASPETGFLAQRGVPLPAASAPVPALASESRRTWRTRPPVGQEPSAPPSVGGQPSASPSVGGEPAAPTLATSPEEAQPSPPLPPPAHRNPGEIAAEMRAFAETRPAARVGILRFADEVAALTPPPANRNPSEIAAEMRAFAETRPVARAGILRFAEEVAALEGLAL